MNFTVIFDFDGTLADTMGIGIEIYNKHLSGKFGLPKSIKELTLEARHQSTSTVIKQHLKWWNTVIVGFLWEKYSFDYIPRAKLFKGMAAIVLMLKKRGFKVGILSSNTHRNVIKCLQNNDLDVFDFVQNNSPLTSKTKALNKIFENDLADKNRAIYIGDEIKDIRSCKEVGLPIISVNWGFNHAESLVVEQPDFFVKSPDELQKLLLDDFPLIEAKLKND